MGIKISALTKKYDSFGKTVVALDGVSINIKEGEFIAIVGESGSGKTTLLNCLCGVDKPDYGSIFLDDEDITAMPQKKLAKLRRTKIGVIYQFYNLVPELNIRDNITLPVELGGGEINESELAEIFRRVGLEGRELDFPSQLSGGQQQRVAIARALFQKPSILLADEPTGNLDEKTGDEILKLLFELNRERKITVIMVTHSKAASDIARRVISLRNGLVVSDEKK